MKGIFNFISKNPSVEEKPSKRTFPKKIYGVSQESPNEFKLSHTLVNLDGYSWKQPSQLYFSELRHNSVVGSLHAGTDFSSQHRKRFDKDQFCFKRKKGLLTDFMDNHAWKKRVIPLLGAERSQQGRSLRNIQYNRLRQQNSLKKSCLKNIRLHYSQRKQKDQHETNKTQSRFLQNTSIVKQRPITRLPCSLRLNSIQTFQKFISRSPNGFKQKFNEGNSLPIERSFKSNQKGIYSFNITNKSKPNSTHEGSESFDNKLSTKNRKNNVINRSMHCNSKNTYNNQ